MSHASVPDQAFLASRRHASRQQQQEVQGVPRSAAVEPQTGMIHGKGAGEAGEDVAGRILVAAKARSKLTLTKPSTILPPRSAPGGNHENPRLIRSHRPAGHIQHPLHGQTAGAK